MNNISKLFENNTDIETLRSNGYGAAGFEIATSPVYFDAGQGFMNTTEKNKVVFRTDSGEPLGVHGSRYVPVAPSRMIDATRNILERSDLNTQGVTEVIRTSHNGSRTFVQYNLPAHKFETPDGDTACLSLLATTSFDSSWPFMISAAATQFACLNLQVFVSGEVAVYKTKHTRGLDIDKGSRIIMKSLDLFESERETWAWMLRTGVSYEEAVAMIAQATQHKSLLDVIAEEPHLTAGEWLSMARSNPNTNYVWNQLLKVYEKRFGLNHWAVYNALTDWSTHAPATKRTAAGNLAALQSHRQQQVRRVVSDRVEFLQAA